MSVANGITHSPKANDEKSHEEMRRRGGCSRSNELALRFAAEASKNLWNVECSSTLQVRGHSVREATDRREFVNSMFEMLVLFKTFSTFCDFFAH